MDVEMVSAEDVAPVAPAHPPSRGQFTVVIDESHPFDLEAYISNYSGNYPEQPLALTHVS